MSTLEFQLNLSGNFAAALSGANHELDKTGEHAKHASKEIELFEGEVGKLSGSVGGLGFNLEALAKGGSVFTFDLAEGLHEAYEVAEKLVDAVIDVGKEMVETAAKTQDLDLAIKLDVGDEGLEKVDKLAESFKGGRFSPAALKKALLPILEESGDEHADQWDDLVTAATDVATRRNTGAAGAAAALDSLRSIEIMPQKIRGALKDLGIKQKDFYSDLGGLLGISEQAAEKEVKAGKVKADTLLNIALHQIAEREGGALGNATNEGNKTLGASLDRLANLKENLFEGVAKSPGMVAIQGFLDNVADTLEVPLGEELVGKVSTAFETLFGDLSGPDGVKKVEAAIGDAVHEAETLIDDFKGAWPDIKKGAEDLWIVFKGIAKTIGTIVDGWVQLQNFIHDWDSGQVAKDIVDTIKGEHGGIATGNTPKNMHWDESIQGYRPNAPDGLEIHGLSQLQGANAGGGAGVIDLPKFAEGGIVDRPTIALVGEKGPELITPFSELRRSLNKTAFSESEGGGGARSVSIDVGDLIFQLAPGAPQEQVREAGQEFRSLMKGFLDEVAA